MKHNLGKLLKKTDGKNNDENRQVSEELIAVVNRFKKL